VLPAADAHIVNNATTLEDAEDDDTPFEATRQIIERTRGLLDAIRAAAPRLRCCIDPWSKSNPGETLRALLHLEIDKTGQLTAATIDDGRSSDVAPEVRSCLLAVAKSLSYPPSSGEAVFEIPIQTRSLE
jgi:hypothetical protein